MSFEFKTQAHAKWILCGEHTVIRGGAAITLPLLDHDIILAYQPNQDPLHIVCNSKEISQENFLQLIQIAMQQINLSPEIIKGTIQIHNHIPSGGGLGLSAALSVVLTRWLAYLYPDKIDSIFHFSKSIENHFHQKSSGIDIIGSINTQAIYYQPTEHATQFIQINHPYIFTLTHTGQRSQTKPCVEQVMHLFELNSKQGQQTDEQMKVAVQLAQKGLNSKNYSKGLKLLKESIMLAQNCFEKWQLVDPNTQKICDNLYSEGALATKITGSGQGGYVLALWEHEPPLSILQSNYFTMIQKLETDPRNMHKIKKAHLAAK